MIPLDVGRGTASQPVNATLRSQQMSLAAYLYLFAADSHNLRACRDVAALRQAGPFSPVLNKSNKWRTRCPRASRHSSQSVSWPLWQPVVKTRQLKNSLWLTQNRFQVSQPTPANTNKPVGKINGQAFWPVCTHRAPAAGCTSLILEVAA